MHAGHDIFLDVFVIGGEILVDGFEGSEEFSLKLEVIEFFFLIIIIIFFYLEEFD
jgi:hypothetical protein